MLKIHDIWEGNVTKKIERFKLRTSVPFHALEGYKRKSDINEVGIWEFRVYQKHVWHVPSKLIVQYTALGRKNRRLVTDEPVEFEK